MYDILNIFNHLIPSITIAYLVYIWTRTNAVYDYILKWNIFNILPFVKSYKTFIETTKIDFNVWLQTDGKFFTKLISCPFCLIFWVSLPVGLIGGYNVFVLAFLAYICFKAL